MLRQPTTYQYFGIAALISRGGNDKVHNGPRPCAYRQSNPEDG